MGTLRNILNGFIAIVVAIIVCVGVVLMTTIGGVLITFLGFIGIVLVVVALVYSWLSERPHS